VKLLSMYKLLHIYTYITQITYSSILIVIIFPLKKRFQNRMDCYLV